ncbi:DUF551 domain-containing protein [Aquirhabdus parva]|uniref:DUF551 domain-containing protein n=1 Tax=Aquirhabdus parva TaxID=2283318 RepID=UPI0013B433DC|nr:DUF551 domain-containing protein [Aquirhabdus parva]
MSINHKAEVIRLTSLITEHNAQCLDRCGKTSQTLSLSCTHKGNDFRSCTNCPANWAIKGVEAAAPASDETDLAKIQTVLLRHLQNIRSNKCKDTSAGQALESIKDILGIEWIDFESDSWISTKDRYPDNEDDVLIWDGFRQRVAFWVSEKSVVCSSERPYEGEAVYDDDSDMLYWPADWYSYEDGPEMNMAVMGTVSHWQPLKGRPNEVQS